MPATISNKKYYIKINSSGVYIKFRSKMASAYIIPLDITSNENMQANKTYNISTIRDKPDKTHINIKQAYYHSRFYSNDKYWVKCCLWMSKANMR